jgi:hypothetical protein
MLCDLPRIVQLLTLDNLPNQFPAPTLTCSALTLRELGYSIGCRSGTERCFCGFAAKRQNVEATDFHKDYSNYTHSAYGFLRLTVPTDSDASIHDEVSSTARHIYRLVSPIEVSALCFGLCRK